MLFIIHTLITNARHVDCSTKLQNHANSGSRSSVPLGHVGTTIPRNLYLHTSGNRALGHSKPQYLRPLVLDVPLEFRLCVLEYSTATQIMNSELLPGGRWLLTCSTRNQYYLHDLHMSSPHPQELVNPGQYDDESGMLDELTSLQIWVDNSKADFCFCFVVWNHGGSLKRELD